MSCCSTVFNIKILKILSGIWSVVQHTLIKFYKRSCSKAGAYFISSNSVHQCPATVYFYSIIEQLRMHPLLLDPHIHWLAHFGSAYFLLADGKKVLPIFKKEDPNDCDNYRGVSLLTHLTNCMQDQTIECLGCNVSDVTNNVWWRSCTSATVCVGRAGELQ